MKMKQHLLVAIFSFTGITMAQDTYTLAQKGQLIPQGVTITESGKMSIKDMKLKIQAAGQEIPATQNMTETRKSTIKALPNGKYAFTRLSKESEQKMNVMGQDQEVPAQKSTLIDKPVIVEKKEGKWIASLKKGEADPAQKLELEQVISEFENMNDEKIYGTGPRKVGDTWKIDGGNMLGIENAKGTVTVKFEKVGEYNGEKCAFLTGDVDITGSPIEKKEEAGEDLQMSLKGKISSIRSLKHLVDLKTEFKGTMDMKGNLPGAPGQNMSMTASGPMSFSSEKSVSPSKKPVPLPVP